MLQRWPGMLAILAGLVFALREETPGHYLTWLDAAQRLWRGEPAYGVSLLTGPFLYSPSFGAFFYGAFLPLPTRLGLALYLLLISTTWVIGVDRLTRTFLRLAPSSRALQPALTWIWGLQAAALWISVRTHKPELLTFGILFLAISYYLESRSLFLAGLAAGIITQFKPQPLPILGLMLIDAVSAGLRDRIRFFLGAAAGFVIAFLLPFAVFDNDYLWLEMSRWSRTLAEFSASSFLLFDNLFKFMHGAMGFSPAFSLARQLILAAAVLLVGLQWLMRRERQEPLRVLFAMVAGTGLTMALGPLHQTNAYVIHLPVLIGVLWLGWRRTAVAYILFMSLAYSDLIPKAWSLAAREIALRAVVCTALSAAVGYRLLRLVSAFRATQRTCSPVRPR